MHAEEDGGRPPHGSGAQRAIRSAVINIALAAVYFATGKLGLLAHFVDGNVTLIWPPTGIAVAAVLTYGYRVWPGLALGAFLITASTGVPLGLAVGTMLGNPLQAILALAVLKRCGWSRAQLESIPQVIQFVLFAGLLSTLVSATIGTLSLCLTGLLPWSSFWSPWFIWWLGDTMGVLLVAPLVLSLANWRREHWTVARATEAGTLLFGAALGSVIIFSEHLGNELAHSLTYFAFPVVILAAVRLRQHGVSLTIFIISSVAILATAHRSGPFVHGDLHVNLVYLHSFLGILAVAGMLLSAAFAERRHARMDLEEERHGLDMKVRERTAELSNANTQLRKEIEEHKKTATKLQESLAHLHEAQAVARLDYWKWDAKRNELTVPTYNASPFGGTPEELMGLSDEDYVEKFVHPEDRERVLEAYGPPGAKKTSIDIEYRMIGSDGKPSIVHEVGKAEFDEDGEMVSLFGTIQDITEKKQGEIALREKEEILRELQSNLLRVSRVSAMGQMSAALAHQLNQPLTAIMNYANASGRLMRSRRLGGPKKAREMIDKAADQANRAGQMIRSLRHFFEKGELVFAVTDMNTTVEETCALAILGASESGVTMELQLCDGLLLANIDKIQIQQALLNLIRNSMEAMEHTETRQLLLQTSRTENNAILVSVSDTGPGVPSSLDGQLFEPLVTSKEEGMGMGLAINRSIIEAHGGQIWDEPNPGGGAIFRFTVPDAKSLKTFESPRPRRSV